MTRLAAIQIARASAASIVVLHHAVPLTIDAIGEEEIPPNLYWLFPGYAGVDIFFVISGYIMCYIAATPHFEPKDFALARIVRVFPFYWLFTMFFLIGQWVRPGPSPPGPSASSLALSPLAAPQDSAPILGVGWSLEHEIIFYLIVGLCFSWRLGRALPYVLFGLFIVGVGMHVLLYEAYPLQLWDFHVFSLYHLEFLTGVLLFIYKGKINIKAEKLFVAGIVILLATNAVLQSLPSVIAAEGHVSTMPKGYAGLLRVCGYSLAGLCILGALLRTEKAGSFNARGGRLVSSLVLLGDASYVLYLSHPLILGGFRTIVAHVDADQAARLGLLLVGVTSCFVFALLFHINVERPALDRLRAIVRGDRLTGSQAVSKA